MTPSLVDVLLILYCHSRKWILNRDTEAEGPALVPLDSNFHCSARTPRYGCRSQSNATTNESQYWSNIKRDTPYYLFDSSAVKRRCTLFPTGHVMLETLVRSQLGGLGYHLDYQRCFWASSWTNLERFVVRDINVRGLYLTHSQMCFHFICILPQVARPLWISSRDIEVAKLA